MATCANRPRSLAGRLNPIPKRCSRPLSPRRAWYFAAPTPTTLSYASTAFISSQRMGMDVFTHIDPGSTAGGGRSRGTQQPSARRADCASGPHSFLTVANWSGQWPGLVGMLNSMAARARAGVPYSTIWSKDSQGSTSSSRRCTRGFIRSTSSMMSRMREFVGCRRQRPR